MRKVLAYFFVILYAISWVGVSYAVNTHGTPDVAKEQQAWFGDGFNQYVVSGCAPAVPSSSLTIQGLVCKGYVRGSSGDLVYVSQPSSGVGPLNSGDGTYWLALHRDTTTVVGGWVRQAGKHYLWKKAATQPVDPAEGMVFASGTVVGGVITATAFQFGTNPLRLGVISIEDPEFLLDPDPTVDASAAWQAAINVAHGRCITGPARRYVIATGLTYSTTGYAPGLCITLPGMYHTVFDNRVANGAMLTVNGSVTSSRFQFGMRLSGFSITTTTSPAASHGISLKGVWLGEIRQVCIGGTLCALGGSGLTGDGIRLLNDLGDPDSSTNLDLKHLHITDNGGIGVRFANATAVNAMGYVHIDQSIISRNVGGGILLKGLAFKLTQTSIGQNSGIGGLYIDYDGVGNRNAVVDSCQFDSNTGTHIYVQSIFGLTLSNNQFKSTTGTLEGTYGPTRMIQFGDGTGSSFAYGVTMFGNIASSSPTTPPVNTTYVYIDPTSGASSGILILNTNYDSFDINQPTAIKYDDAGSIATIFENGRWIHSKLSTTITTATVGGTVTPNTLISSYHRYSLTDGGAGTVTVGVPLWPSQGQELILDFYNGHASDVIISWNAVYKDVRSFILKAGGGRKATRFFADASTGSWVAIGSSTLFYFGTNASVALGLVSAQTTTTFTITVNGAMAGCTASASPRAGALSAGFVAGPARVSATNTVEVQVGNITAGALTPATLVWDAAVSCP